MKDNPFKDYQDLFKIPVKKRIQKMINGEKYYMYISDEIPAVKQNMFVKEFEALYDILPNLSVGALQLLNLIKKRLKYNNPLVEINHQEEGFGECKLKAAKKELIENNIISKCHKTFYYINHKLIYKGDILSVYDTNHLLPKVNQFVEQSTV